METEYKHIRFVEVPTPEGRKTSVWNCLGNDGASLLGMVRWFGRWRQYCFYPESNTIFNVGCMMDVGK